MLLECDDLADERDDAPWRFRDELLREAAYALLPDDERSTAHRRAARWLSARGGVDMLAIAEHHERGA